MAEATTFGDKRLTTLWRLCARLSEGLFGTWTNTLITISLAGVFGALAVRFFRWAFLSAVWVAPAADAASCRTLRGQGACWAVVHEKYRFLLFATYPYAEQWRPALACIILIALLVFSTRSSVSAHAIWLSWVLGLILICVLMWGGLPGMPYVRQELWGGLPVTLLLAMFGIALALPIGILLALGRRSTNLPVIRILCAGYIELIRAIPLVSLLFMAMFVFPIFLPAGVAIDKLLRAQIALIMFSAAYIAEVVRGGLQSISVGQYEGATALGLGYWRAHVLVILPQVLRATVPALVNTSISIFKSTSLVLVIGLFDLLSAGKAAIVEPQWQSYGLEMYIAISLIYFAFCASLSRYSKRLELPDHNKR